MTRRIIASMAATIAAGLLLAACGSASSETEKLRAEIEALREQIESTTVAATAATTTTIESTTTVSLPPDPRATVAEAEAAWAAQPHPGLTATEPVLLDGVPIAATSSEYETILWQWDGVTWGTDQYISHADDPISYLSDVYLRDLSGDGQPELLIHYGYQDSESLEVFTPVFDMFIPVEVDGSLLYNYEIRRPTWRVDGTRVIMTTNSCSPYCAVGAMIDIAFHWDDGMLVLDEVTCPSYRDARERGDGYLAICDKGPLVLAVQRALNNGNFGFAEPDGYFGPATRASVIQFQHIFGMEKTGALHPMDVEFLLDYYS